MCVCVCVCVCTRVGYDVQIEDKDLRHVMIVQHCTSAIVQRRMEEFIIKMAKQRP